jgi:hypothetical protein
MEISEDSAYPENEIEKIDLQDGDGKDVRLNTESGVLSVFDDEHRLIFSKIK